MTSGDYNNDGVREMFVGAPGYSQPGAP